MKARGKKENSTFLRMIIKDRRLHTVLLSLLGFILIFLILLAASAPKRHSLRVGEIALQTITATKDVEDEVATLLKQQNAANQVIAIYSKDDTITERVKNQLQTLFGDVTLLRTVYKEQLSKPTQPLLPTFTPSLQPSPEGTDALFLPPEQTPVVSFTPLPTQTPFVHDAQTLEELRRKHPVLQSFSNKRLMDIIAVKDTEFEACKAFLDLLLTETMDSPNGLQENDRKAAVNVCLVRMDETKMEDSLKALGKAVISSYLEANVFFDEKATNEAKEEAMQAVSPVMYKKGQNIVMQGEVVTDAQYAMMQKLGIIQDSKWDSSLYWGLGLLVFLMWSSLQFCVFMFYPDMMTSIKKTLLYIVIILLELGIAILLRDLNPYFIPAQMAAILISVLLHRRLALFINAIVSLCIGIIAFSSEGLLSSSAFPIVIMAHFSSSAAICLLTKTQHRFSFLLAGLIIGGLNALAVFSAGILIDNSIHAVVNNALNAIVGGFISGVLSIGFLPALEIVFSLPTAQKLLELSNSNQPLLRRLQTEAPGSYQHSLMVANLAQAAADEIDANTLLVRVGAYYHDIGKLNRPVFFRENQLTEENPHDKLPPDVSAAIIKAHVTEGVELAQRAKLPPVIVDFVRQHHGTTQQAYFYYTALKAAEEKGETISIQDYSYDGPKPQTKEVAIVALADTVEAATRSMKTRTPESIRALIHKLISDRINDGQLSESPLSLMDIHKMEESFNKTVSSMYHERIEYPSLNKNGQLQSGTQREQG